MARIEAEGNDREGLGLTNKERALIQFLRTTDWGASEDEEGKRLNRRKRVKDYLDSTEDTFGNEDSERSARRKMVKNYLDNTEGLSGGDADELRKAYDGAKATAGKKQKHEEQDDTMTGLEFDRSSQDSYSENEGSNYPLAENNGGGYAKSGSSRKRQSSGSESARSWNQKLSVLGF